jgi:hypothetical protein
MQSPEPELRTGDALSIAGLPRKTWEDLLHRKRFDEAPAETTQSRRFSVDDVLCLSIVRHYLDTGAGPTMAGRVASAVRKELAKAGPDLQTLWVVNTIDGTPCRVMAQRPKGAIADQIPVAELRQSIRQAVVEKLAEQRP